MNEPSYGLAKVQENRLPKFVEDAYESIEKMQNFAKILLESQLVPHHFYEKKPVAGVANKYEPDFTKGKIPAVVAVLIQGYQLDLPPLTALQHVIPVNGLLSIKGDLAKSMIFRSGKLKPDTWVESFEGSIEDQNLIITITAERSDNGMKSRSSFSVAQAKRAGLWIDESKTKGQDGWKFLASAWWKYPERMIYYRVLGFIARDLFSDILQGLYTTEEANDIPQDQTVVLQQENGSAVVIPNSDFAADRSKKSTTRAVNKIEGNKFEKVPEPEKKTVIPAGDKSPEDIIPEQNQGSQELREGQIDGDQLDKMETEDLMTIINTKEDMVEALLIVPGRNTKKKLREIIEAFQANRLAAHCAPYIKDDGNAGAGDPPEDIHNEVGASSGDTPPDDEHAGSDIAANRSFDEQGGGSPDVIKPKSGELNQYGINVPEYDKGQERDFKTVKELYQAMLNIKPRLDNERLLELAKRFVGFEKYKNKEDFLKYATVENINDLLNENSISL
jgi:hypothetical protein